MSDSNDEVRAIAALALRGDVCSPSKALEVLAIARRERISPATAFAERIPENKILPAIAEELELDYIDLFSQEIAWEVDENVLANLDVSILKTAAALPLLNPETGRSVIALANPYTNLDALTYLSSHIPDFDIALAPISQIQSKLIQLETTDLSELEFIDEVGGADPGGLSQFLSGSGNPVVDWVNNLLSRASAENASDVHFIFQADKSILVRFRVDGTLRRMPVPRELRRRESEIVGTLMSKCPTVDPSNTRIPQDGTFSFVVAGNRRMDARLAMLPQLHGPTVVVRLLDPRNVRRRLDDMGFAPETLRIMRHAVSKPQGLVLMVGPTGSGKTTSLYGLMNELDASELNILTAEDPVEYRMPLIGQTQIRSGLGEKSLTFARTLRSMLRLDPDVMLVGEIRDTETAEVAMHSALTGHLVLSTLHTNSALGVITRLQELHVEPFAIADVLSLSASQRLIKRLHDCAITGDPTVGEIRFLERQGLPIPDKVRHPSESGCGGCNGTGYRGRIPVVEAFVPSGKVQDMIASAASVVDIARAAKEEGHITILQDAFRHVLAGDSSVAELLRTLDSGGIA